MVELCSKCSTNPRRAHSSWCSPCCNLAKKIRYQQNPEKYNSKNQKYYNADNRQKDYTKNKERDLARNRKYRSENYAQTLSIYAKRRARHKGIKFNIMVEDIQKAIDQSNGVCPILHIPLEISTKSMDPNSPSLDRIDNSKGYEIGNIHIISNRANILKRDASLHEMKQIARWVGESV